MARLGKMVAGRIYMGWAVGYPRGLTTRYTVTNPARPEVHKEFRHLGQAERWIRRQGSCYELEGAPDDGDDES